mmetsp:Transcript_4100/g.15441  ORF Transcript_4100/g.15441 Transcript_4100/m.15441 type:complete len:284 (-) Transcript_4100:3201-4052(-)
MPSSLISQAYKKNLDNFENIHELYSDTQKRDQRLERIEEKIRQVYAIREQIFAVRFSNETPANTRESLTTLFQELKEKEHELNMLREHDSMRFIESLQLQSIQMQHPTSVLVDAAQAKKHGSSSHQQFAYFKQMDMAPVTTTVSEEKAVNKQDVLPSSSKEQTSAARSTWRKLIRSVQASTRFMRTLNNSRLERDEKALSYIRKDYLHHVDGSVLSKKELRNEIDEVRALINELKSRRNESNTEKVLIQKLHSRLREMDSAYTDLVLRGSDNMTIEGASVCAY